jgi:class 3 adenylate cyclase/tetratricopeptide (TPR) repeat protein
VFCDTCGLRLVASDWSLAQNDTSPYEADTKRVEHSAPDSASTLAQPETVRPATPQSDAVRSDAPQPSTEITREESGLQHFIPKELQTRLTQARASGEMVGERRVVSMLFCDVRGSTAAAEKMDPEDWGEVINGAFEYMIKPIYRYEGIVARLMGDGLLAFFGAPIAHEDDPQRAIMAGLDIVAEIRSYRELIQEQHGVDFDVRVGINTGLVVVGAVGSDLRMEYTALGDAINLASRMEQTAVPGTVQVAQDTFKLVKPLFEFEELGGIEVKGKAEPVPAYRVVGSKTLATRTRGIEGLHAEMVGREAEMQTLREVMSDLKQGVGRIVCVLGDAGMGKSRLISETHNVFEQLVGSDGDWYATTTLSYEANQAYGMFQRLLRRMMGIAYEAQPSEIEERLASIVEILPEARRPRARQVLEALFGIEAGEDDLPMEGETFKRELLEVIQDWWRASFSARPKVIVFDDMHWSDAASIELLTQLMPLIEEIPLVLLCALRAERDAPAWQLKAAADENYPHRYREFSLQPLSQADCSELVSRLLAISEISDAMREAILEKSGGNPFFIEEVVRTLIENGAVASEERSDNGELKRYWRSTSVGTDFAIPDNLRSLLAARMDRLEEATRATLQVASVIGRNFHRRVLQEVDDGGTDVDKNVGALLRLELIREAARVPEVEYTFRNPLTQEAVYKTILLKRRREFHRRVGEAMESLYADRLDGFYGLLAHHFALAGERDKAVEYSRQESKQAVALYAFEDAVQNLRAALDLIEPGDQSEIHGILLEDLADVYALLRDGNQAIEHYQSALEIWDQQKDGDRLVEVRLDRKIVQVVTDLKWSVSLEHLQQAEEARQKSLTNLKETLSNAAEELPNLETVRAFVALSTDAWRIQEPPDWEAAEQFAKSAVDMAQQLDKPVDLSQAYGALANVLDGRSRLRDHLQVAEQRLAICRDPAFDDVREQMEALRGMGAALMYVGEYSQALPYLEEAEALASQVMAADQMANAVGLQAQCMFRMDRWDDVLALENNWRELEGRFSREQVGETCFFVALSGSVFALRGDPDHSNSYAKEAFDYMVSMSGEPEHWQRNQFY